MSIHFKMPLDQVFNYFTTIKFNKLKKSISVLLVAQLFGLMPVIGILSSNANSIIFRWRSIRMLHTISVIFFGCSLLWLILKHTIGLGLQAKNFGKYFFFRK